MMIDRLRYNQNWNIGFSDITPEAFIKDKKLASIQWMKHHYNDRFFADPFILKVTDNEIVLFAEECLFQKPNGRIVELIVDKRTKRLKKRYLLLENETHLSYPAILYIKDRVYVYPENGSSGALNLYTYDEENHKLINPETILDEAIADSTIIESNDRFFLVATKYPETQEKVFLYASASVKGPYSQCDGIPFNVDRRFSRPAGNFININGILYRPAQDCVKRYGAGLSIMKISSLAGQSLKENYEFSVYPQSFKYNLGLHTINFSHGTCVIDGYGYLFPLIGRVYNSKLFALIKNGAKALIGRR